MGTRADFYLERADKRLMWIGSKAHDGSPWNISTDILIQINPAMFEEMVTDFLKANREDSIIRQEGDKWPWPWADSRLSDYSYIFMMDKVFAWTMRDGGLLFDPLKVVQGHDLDYAKVPFHVNFPIMNRSALKTMEEVMEIVNNYGSKSSETV